MNALKQAFKDLNTAYKNSLQSYLNPKHVDASKFVCLPTLDCQLLGPLLQYKLPWNKANKDPDACHCCEHHSTMPVELQAEVNTKNRKLHTKASADGGDGKFKPVSATKVCYAYLQNCRGHVAVLVVISVRGR